VEILGLVYRVFVEEERQHIDSLRNTNPLFEMSQRLVIESFKYQPGCFYASGFFINFGKLSSRLCILKKVKEEIPFNRV